MTIPKVYIVILNYKNLSDTIECLDSLFNLNYMNFSVVVCDNGSEDHSIESIQAWAKGTCQYHPLLEVPDKFFLKAKIGKKPISCIRLGIDQDIKNDHFYMTPSLFIIDNKVNLGFGAGNNVGIRWALKDPEMEYVWILNNDTVVDPDALIHLTNKMASDPNLGSCGNTILYYHDPEIVQALGGFTYTPWIGKSLQIGHLKKWKSYTPGNFLEMGIEKKMYWIQGASILLKKEFLERVGLISEDYFLYFEEQDFGVRSRKFFRTGYASHSIVYHKEGRTTGSKSFIRRKKALISEFYLTRSRLLFTQKYYPNFLPLIYVSHFYIAIRKLLRGQWKNASVVLLCSVYFGREEITENGHPYERFKKWISMSKVFGRLTSTFYPK